MVNTELLDTTTRTVPDETPNYVNPEEQCFQDRNKSNNGPDSDTQPSISQSQMKLDMT